MVSAEPALGPLQLVDPALAAGSSSSAACSSAMLPLRLECQKVAATVQFPTVELVLQGTQQAGSTSQPSTSLL